MGAGKYKLRAGATKYKFRLGPSNTKWGWGPGPRSGPGKYKYPKNHEFSFEFKFAEAAVLRCSIKNGVLRNLTKFSGKHLWHSLFFNIIAGLQLYYKRDSGTGVFLWILWTSKNNILTKHLRTSASKFSILIFIFCCLINLWPYIPISNI